MFTHLRLTMYPHQIIYIIYILLRFVETEFLSIGEQCDNENHTGCVNCVVAGYNVSQLMDNLPVLQSTEWNPFRWTMASHVHQ